MLDAQQFFVFIIVGTALLLSLYSLGMGSSVYEVQGEFMSGSEGNYSQRQAEETVLPRKDAADKEEDFAIKTTPRPRTVPPKTLPPPAKSGRPVHVLLLTEGRSGSTWLSSFFWHRKDVYYTFEPLFPTRALKNSGCYNSEERTKECHQEILRQFWKCDFHTSKLTVLGRYNRYKLPCDQVSCSIQNRERMCGAATHRVAKTIRFWHLEYLEELMTEDIYDIRVIHLVRDPRPLVYSRKGWFFGSLDGIHPHPQDEYTDEQLTSESSTLCSRMLDVAKLGDNPPPWLEGRYKRITHEQLSGRPVETTKALYKFAGLRWTNETEAFVNSTAQGNFGDGGAYGLKRISSKEITKWRHLSEEFIQLVTDACNEFIRYLGYEDDMRKIRLWKENEGELWDSSKIKNH